MRLGRRNSERGRRLAPRRGGLGPLALALVSLAAAPGRAGAGECDPWPGEPVPLPAVSDSDTLRAQWAELRARELARVARRVEADDPAEAQRLWRRLLCLDPDSRVAQQGLAQYRPVRVHRPPVVGGGDFGEEASGDPWADLSVPVAIRTVRARAPAPEVESSQAAPAELLRRADGLIAETEARVRAARFEDALAVAGDARLTLDDVGEGERRPRLARLEVLRATAELALGRGDAARQSFGRALAADPNLELDAASTPPKVRRALAAARAAREVSP